MDIPTAAVRAEGGTFAALRYPGFRLLWSGVLLTSAGTWLQMVAQDFLVFRLTGRTLDIATVAAVRAIPVIVLSPFAGRVVDRVNRRALLALTQSLSALQGLAMGWLVWTGQMRVPHLIAFSFLHALVLVFDYPVRQALVPFVVPARDLRGAVALNHVAFGGAAVLGPAVVGIVAADGSGHHLARVFVLRSVTALILAAVALMLPHGSARRAEGRNRPEPTQLCPAQLCPAVVRDLAVPLALLLIVGFFLAPYQALLPAYSRTLASGGGRLLGQLHAWVGAGSVLGCLFCAWQAGTGRAARVGESVCWIVFAGAAVAGLICTRFVTVACLLLLCLGMALAAFQSLVQANLHERVADELRGRVMALYGCAVIALWPLGALPLTAGADRWGWRSALAVAVLITLILTTAVTLPGRLRATVAARKRQ